MYSNIILSFFILLFLFPGQKIVRLLFFFIILLKVKTLSLAAFESIDMM